MPRHSDPRVLWLPTLRWAKIGPPRRGRHRKSAGYVAPLARVADPHCASLLASGLPVAMTTPPPNQDRL